MSSNPETTLPEFPRQSFPNLYEDMELDVDESIVYGETIFTSDRGNEIVEEDTTPLGLYSAELGEGGKKQQDSLACLTVEKENGQKETWMMVADGVSMSKDGAKASSRLIHTVTKDLEQGASIHHALLDVAHEFADDNAQMLAERKAKSLHPQAIDILGEGEKEFNPLLATTFVGLKVENNGEAKAYRLGDGQIYVARAREKGKIEKIDKGELTPVDFKAEADLYHNPQMRALRSVAGGSLRGNIDLKKLYLSGDIELVGRTASLTSEIEKMRRIELNSTIPKSVTQSLEYFSEGPETQIQKLEEVSLGELEQGDVCIVCSDGIENNILSEEISKIVEFARKKSKDGNPDPNLIREKITAYIQKIMSGKISKDYAKPDNFSIIVYMQTADGTEEIDLNDVEEIQPFEISDQPLQ